MENQKASAKSIMLNFGLILGIVSIFINVINFAFGDVYDPHWIISVISAITSIVVIVFGLKKFKEGNGGLLGLSESIKIGLGISLISGIVYLVYFYLFANFIEADYFVNLAKLQEVKLLEQYPNFTDEQMEGALATAKKMSGFGMISAMILIFSLFFGFIFSLVAGLIMKKTEEDI